MTKKEAVKYLISKGIDLEKVEDAKEEAYCLDDALIMFEDQVFLHVLMNARKFKTTFADSIYLEDLTYADLDKFVRDVERWRSLEERRSRKDAMGLSRLHRESRNVDKDMSLKEAIDLLENQGLILERIK